MEVKKTTKFGNSSHIIMDKEEINNYFFVIPINELKIKDLEILENLVKTYKNKIN